MHKLPACLFGGFFVLAGLVAHASEATTADEIRATAVPASQEPLHVVRYDAEPFMIYTNDVMPGIWTQYHQHHSDLLAVIAGGTQVGGQVPGEEAKSQNVPSGTVAFFPYSDSAAPYVHRVGVTGEQPFVNVGLEFHGPLGDQCQRITPWQDPAIATVTSNRRGSAYHLLLASGASAALPEQGRGLLLVPLDEPKAEKNLLLDSTQWLPALGDFRFYSDFNQPQQPRPATIKNNGSSNVRLVVFVAC